MRRRRFIARETQTEPRDLNSSGETGLLTGLAGLTASPASFHRATTALVGGTSATGVVGGSSLLSPGPFSVRSGQGVHLNQTLLQVIQNNILVM